MKKQIFTLSAVIGIIATAAPFSLQAAPAADNSVENIAAFISACDEDPQHDVTISNSVVAIYQNGSSLYVKDDSGYLLVNGTISRHYENGMSIPGGISGLPLDSAGVYQLASPRSSSFLSGTMGEPVKPVYIDYSELASTAVNTYVTLNSLTFNQDLDGEWTLLAGGVKLPMENKFGIDLIEGGVATVCGFIGLDDGKAQLYPISVEMDAPVPTPTFSVASGWVKEGTQVAITCADPKATIFYNTDGSNTYHKIYKEPITITDYTVLKAIAINHGERSLTARATYIIDGNVRPGEEESGEGYFNFTYPNTLQPAYDNSDLKPTDKEGYYTVNLNNVVFTSGLVSLVNEQTTSGKDACFYTFVCEYYDNWAYRMFEGSVSTISVPESYNITSIEFGIRDNKSLRNLADCDFNTGSLNGTLWTSDESTPTVELYVKDTVELGWLRVTYENVAGVEDLEADGDAPVEYFNLQGVRVDNPSQGIYIRRQGTKVTKVKF